MGDFLISGMIISGLFSLSALAKSVDAELDFDAENALVLDVRSKREYEEKHIEGSQNLPLEKLKLKGAELDKSRKIIVCSEDGRDSLTAYEILKSAGYRVFNAGSWKDLARYLTTATVCCANELRADEIVAEHAPAQ